MAISVSGVDRSVCLSIAAACVYFTEFSDLDG